MQSILDYPPCHKTASACFSLINHDNLLILKVWTNDICIACCRCWFFNYCFWHIYNLNKTAKTRSYGNIYSIKTLKMATLTTQRHLTVKLVVWTLTQRGCMTGEDFFKKELKSKITVYQWDRAEQIIKWGNYLRKIWLNKYFLQ